MIVLPEPSATLSPPDQSAGPGKTTGLSARQGAGSPTALIERSEKPTPCGLASLPPGALAPPAGRQPRLLVQGRRTRLGPGVGRHLLPRRAASLSVLGSDILALSVALIGGVAADEAVHGQLASWSPVLLGVVYVAVFLPLFSAYGLYRRARRRLVASIFPDLGQLIHALLLGYLVLVVGTPRLHALLGLPVLGIERTVVVGIGAFVLVPLARAATRSLTRPAGGARILLVGSGRVADVVAARFSSVADAEVVGYVDDSQRCDTGDPDLPKLGTLDDLPALVSSHRIDQIVVAFTPASGAKLADLLRTLAGDVKISVVPRLFDLLTIRSHVDDLHGLPVVDVAPATLSQAARCSKRALDLGTSLVGLAFLLPLMAVVALAVAATSDGPVLYRQERSGRGGKPFDIYKFRTMYDGADRERTGLTSQNEVDGPLFKVREDPRITSIGGFLRRTSLDELPQLFNVVAGHMSLVGPRPFIDCESSMICGWAARRFEVRPGVTGLWQISGRSDLPFEELCRLDYSYVASWSLLWDLRIMWHTPAAVLRRRGAY